MCYCVTHIYEMQYISVWIDIFGITVSESSLTVYSIAILAEIVKLNLGIIPSRIRESRNVALVGLVRLVFHVNFILTSSKGFLSCLFYAWSLILF